MIKIHRWHCLQCDKKWYKKIDDENEIDKLILGTYENNVSVHVLENGHEVQHVEKGDTVFKFA